MRDKLSIAAFVVSAMAFLVVLVSPAPEAPAESAGTRSEGIVNRGQAEANALDEDARELERLKSRGEALGAMHGKTRPDESETDRLVAGMIERETKGRWPAFQNRLKIIRLYEKKPSEKKADENAAAARAAAAKQAALKRAVALKEARAAAEKKRADLLKAREAARKKAAEKKANQDKVEGGEW